MLQGRNSTLLRQKEREEEARRKIKHLLGGKWKQVLQEDTLVVLSFPWKASWMNKYSQSSKGVVSHQTLLQNIRVHEVLIILVSALQLWILNNKKLPPDPRVICLSGGWLGHEESWNLKAYKTSTFSFQMCLTGETSHSGNLNPNLLAAQTEQRVSASQQAFDFKWLWLVCCNFNQGFFQPEVFCELILKMQAQFKIYEIKSWGPDSSPSYISTELLQLTSESGSGTVTQKE